MFRLKQLCGVCNAALKITSNEAFPFSKVNPYNSSNDDWQPCVLMSGCT